MSRWTSPTAAMMGACAALLSFAVTPAESQSAPSTVYVVMNDQSACLYRPIGQCEVTKLVRATLDAAGGRVDWTRDLPQLLAIHEARVTPDGASLLVIGWPTQSAPERLYLHDLASGGTSDLGPLPSVTALAVNPQRLEVYVVHPGGVLVLSPNGLRQLDHGCTPSLAWAPAAISADGERMSYVCGFDTIVFETRTGQLVRRLPYRAVMGFDAGEVYGVEFDRLRRRRVATDEVLADVPPIGTDLVVDPATGDILEFGRGGGAANSLTLRDRYSLSPRWSLPTGLSDWPLPVVDAASSLLYFPVPYSIIGVADRRTGTVLGMHRLFAPEPLAIATAPASPPAPVVAPPTIQGRAVQLAWFPAPPVVATTRYVLEVGSAPGLSNIFSGLDVGMQTSFAASGVPPGTYYVRVRAGNYSGGSAPSNEVVVVVP